jgi:hypothetical protein
MARVFRSRTFLLSFFVPLAIAGVVLADIIDNFNGFQFVSSTTTAASESADDPNILGGERNLYLEVTSTNGGVPSITVTDGAIRFNRPSFSGNVSGAKFEVWYDGDNDSTTFNADFLSTPVDLTSGGTLNAFRIDTTSSTDPRVAFFFRAYSSSSNFSTNTFFLPSGGGAVDLRFSDFTIEGGTGADFSAIRAIRISTVSSQSSVAYTGVINTISTVAVDDRATIETGPNDFRISVAGTDGDGALNDSPAIASNDSGEALIVWYQDAKLDPGDAAAQQEIFGRRVNRNTGATIGAPFRISDMGGTTAPTSFHAGDHPDVVYNSTDDEYFVVWSGDDDTDPDPTLVDNKQEVFGQRVNSDGSFDGGNVRISHMGNEGDANSWALSPSVAWDSENNRYLVVWTGSNSTSSGTAEQEIYGRIVNANGTSFSSDEIRISTVGPELDLGRSGQHPDVVFASESDKFLVVWDATHDAPTAVNIFGQFIDTAGAESGSDFRITTVGASETDANYQATYPSLAYDPDDDRFLVAFKSGVNGVTALGEIEVFGAFVESSGTSASPFRISHAGPDGFTEYQVFEPVVAWKANGWVVAWDGEQVVNDETEIWAHRLTRAGTLIDDEPLQISDMGPPGDDDYYAIGPAVDFRTSPGIVAWPGGDDIGVNLEDEIYGQLIRTTASAADTTITADPATRQVGQTSTITIQVKDDDGTNVTSGGHEVVLNTDLGTLGAVADAGNGTYTATLSSTTSGTATITGTIDGETITDDATVTYSPGAIDPSTTTITANPTSIVANGSSTSTITVQAKDLHGNNLTTGGSTIILQETSGLLGAVTDHSDGTYTAALTSIIVVGTATITGEIQGVGNIVDDATVEFTPGPIADFLVDAPAAATGGDAFNVTVTARDANFNVATGYTGTVQFTSTASSATLPLNYTFTAGDSGTHVFSVTLSSAGNITVTVRDTVTSSITGNDTVAVKGNTTTSLSSSDDSSLVGQSITFTATVTSPTTGTITGTVAFKDGDTELATASLNNGTATFTTSSLTAGSHSITAVYGDSSNFNTSTSSAVNQTVTLGTFGPPLFVYATATSDSTITVSWTPTATSTSYKIYRSTLGGPFNLVTSVPTPTFNDTGRAANQTYLYKVSSDNGAESAQSATDAATTVVFTDPSLSNAIPVRKLHLDELRTAVNAMRAAANLSAATFTDSTITAQSTKIKRLHIVELRTALDEARDAIELADITYTDSSLTAGSTVVKAVHATELRGGTQ